MNVANLQTLLYNQLMLSDLSFEFASRVSPSESLQLAALCTCSSFPFINRGCAAQSVPLGSARDTLSLHSWQPASLGSKKRHTADVLPDRKSVWLQQSSCQ